MYLSMKDFDIFEYPNGEWSVKVNPNLKPENRTEITLLFKWPLNQRRSNFDLMLPIIMGECIKSVYGKSVSIIIPFIPYLRQDRAFHFGQIPTSSLIIKLLKITFDRIITLDAHSIPCSLSKRLISMNFSYPHALRKLEKSNKFDMRGDYLIIAPDENSPIAGNSGVLTMCKQRSQENIIFDDRGVKIPQGTDMAVIVDDLCDGGATFIECAKILKKKGIERIILLVSHGLFTKGVSHLLDNGIDFIITTDSAYHYKDSEEIRESKMLILDSIKETKQW